MRKIDYSRYFEVGFLVLMITGAIGLVFGIAAGWQWLRVLSVLEMFLTGVAAGSGFLAFGLWKMAVDWIKTLD